jgi:hypothetical protein
MFSLSGLNLVSVNAEVLKRLVNLQTLDVSNNKLSGLKSEGFTLNSLKELNCSSNNLLTVDDFVLFPNLEKADVSNNVSLEVADRYKLVSLLPKLKVLEDKEVSVMREAVEKFDGILAAKVYSHQYLMEEDVRHKENKYYY